MARSDMFDARVLSPPCPVLFAGWESTTTRLQQMGWQLSAEEHPYDRRVRLAMKFEPAGIYMVSDTAEHDYFAYGVGPGNRGMAHLPTFHVRQCASRIHIQLHESSFNFQPIDAMPQFVNIKKQSIEDFKLFAPALARTQEIIVEPQSVAECLELIKKMQAPDLEAIRKRRRYQEGSSAPIPQQQFHAQILSIAA